VTASDLFGTTLDYSYKRCLDEYIFSAEITNAYKSYAELTTIGNNSVKDMRTTDVESLIEVGHNCSVNSICGYFDSNANQATWVSLDSTSYKVSFDKVN